MKKKGSLDLQYHTFHIRVARQMAGQGSKNNFDERLIAVKRRQLKKRERKGERVK